MANSDRAPMPGEDTPNNHLPLPGMNRCAITGKECPEDELIEFQGYRVSAEGKAVILERLKSGEKMPGEMERPGFGRRLGCFILDNIILGVCSMLITLAFVGSAALFSPEEGSATALAAATFLNLLLSTAYYTLLHGSYGQTLGKMAGKIKVVNTDGSAVQIHTALIRSLVYIGPQLLSPFFYLLLEPTAANGVTVLAGLYVWVNLIVLLLDKEKHKAIHDRMAGTRVILID